MLRFIVVAIFLIVGTISVLGVFDVSMDGVSEYSDLLDKKTLKEKITIPVGMEKEYNAVLNTSELKDKSKSKESAKQQDGTEKQKTPVNTQAQAADFLSGNKIKSEADITTKQDKNIKAEKNVQTTTLGRSDKFLFKIDGLSFNENHLIADIKVYNNMSIDFTGNLNIRCVGYDQLNRKLGYFKWSKDLSIPSKKVVLVKNIDFGLADTKIKKIDCSY